MLDVILFLKGQTDIHHLFGASLLPGAPESIYSYIHITWMYFANYLLSSHALAALTGAGRLWRENSIVGLLSWSQAFEDTTSCFIKAGQRLRRIQLQFQVGNHLFLSFIVILYSRSIFVF